MKFISIYASKDEEHFIRYLLSRHSYISVLTWVVGKTQGLPQEGKI